MIQAKMGKSGIDIKFLKSVRHYYTLLKLYAVIPAYDFASALALSQSEYLWCESQVVGWVLEPTRMPQISPLQRVSHK